MQGPVVARFLLLTSALVLLGAGCAKTPEAPRPGGVYRSDDGGATFIQRVALREGTFLSPLAPRHVEISTTSPNTLLLVSSTGLYRTDDGGDTWARLRVPAREIVSASIHPRNAQILLAAGTDAANRGTIFKSLNGGATWSDVFTTPVTEAVRGTLVRRRQAVETKVTAVSHDPHTPEVVYAATNTGTLLVSADGGLRWSTRSSLRGGITALKLSPHVPGRMLLRLEDGRLLRSADGGRSTEVAAAGRTGRPSLSVTAPTEAVLSVLFLPGADGTEQILVGTQAGLYLSSDGGVEWSPLPLPPTGTAADVPVRSVARTADGTLWAASGSVLLSSRDVGATWQSVDLPISDPIRFVVGDPVNPARLYLLFFSA